MPLIVGLVGAGTQLGASAINYNKSKESEGRAYSELKRLQNQPVPQFTETPETRNVYSAAVADYVNPQGVTPAEQAAFNSKLAQGYNTQYTNATNRAGGQFGKFFSGVLTANNANATSDFAAAGSRIRSGNRNAAAGRMAQGAGVLQGIADRNTQAALQRRLMLEQLYGSAMGQQKQNQGAIITGIGNIGGLAAGYGFQQAGGRTGGSTGTVTPTGATFEYPNVDPNSPLFQ